MRLTRGGPQRASSNQRVDCRCRRVQPQLGIATSRNDLPLKAVTEIVKAGIADPMVLVESAVACVKNVRKILDHKLGPAERTMIVIPIGILFVPSILSPSELDTGEVLFLPLKPPI